MTSATATTATTWEAPDAGRWEWQGSHVPAVPTPIYGALHLQTMPTAIGRMFERYGVPMRTMAEVSINGRLYASLQPLVGKPGSAPPPKPLLWLATRLHPEFRRRRRTAERVLESRIWRARTEEWRSTLRPAIRATNLALQSEDVAALDDAALADHVRRAHAHVVDGHLLHFDLHGDDMGPLGIYLARCRDLGVEAGDAIAALTGHSPSTTAAVESLRKVAVAVTASGTSTRGVTTLEDLRALGSGVANALDEYLDEYGWRVVTGYDLDAKTVHELPDVLVASVLALPPADTGDLASVGDAAAAAIRDRIPSDAVAGFEEALAEARVALDLRDDNGPITVQWPVGLLRRALLEVGRRAVASGALAQPEHALELALDEVEAIQAGAPGPGAEAVLARAAARAADSAIAPPDTLGRALDPPDLSVFPAALAAVTDMAITCVAHMERTAKAAAHGAPAVPLAEVVGLGVGVGPVRGIACVAHTPEQALAKLAPGEVLVAPFTTPAYNAVLAICGGLVTEQGGALSHAAVLARELELPAVIGVPSALTLIADGDEIEIVPAEGTVRVLPRRSPPA